MAFVLQLKPEIHFPHCLHIKSCRSKSFFCGSGLLSPDMIPPGLKILVLNCLPKGYKLKSFSGEFFSAQLVLLPLSRKSEIIEIKLIRKAKASNCQHQTGQKSKCQRAWSSSRSHISKWLTLVSESLVYSIPFPENNASEHIFFLSHTTLKAQILHQSLGWMGLCRSFIDSTAKWVLRDPPMAYHDSDTV